MRMGAAGIGTNGIPVCFDCHAEIENKRGNKGRKFTKEELRGHRDHWFALVANSPEKLIAASTQTSEAGPLEALLAELKFNNVIAASKRKGRLEITQFQRALAVNAVATLADDSAARV